MNPFSTLPDDIGDGDVTILDSRYVNVTGDTMTGQLVLGLAGVGLSVTQDAVIGGYLRIGSTSAPTNTTAGDITGVRLKIGDGAFGTGVEASVTGDAAISGFLRVGSETAPANTTAGDLTSTRLSVGNTTLATSAGLIANFTGTVTATAAGANAFAAGVNTFTPASNSASEIRAWYFQNIVNPSTGITVGTIRAGVFENRLRHDGTTAQVQGISGQAVILESSSAATVGVVTLAQAVVANHFGRPSGSSVVTITTGVGVDVSAITNNGATYTDLIGLRVNNGANPTITNQYGIQIASLTRHSTDLWGIQVAYPAIATSQGTTTNLIGIGLPTGSMVLSNQTATTTMVAGIYLGIPTYTSTTNVRTVTNMANLYIAGAPVASTNVTVTAGGGPYSIWVDGGMSRFDGRIIGNQGADVASANNLTLGTDGNVFEITGTTQINLIDSTNWQNGSVITLMFTSTPTVKHNQTTSGANIKILLSGAADFSATADDTLTLVLGEIGGTQAWREVARTVI